jgi:hypothetical protein
VADPVRAAHGDGRGSAAPAAAGALLVAGVIGTGPGATRPAPDNLVSRLGKEVAHSDGVGFGRRQLTPGTQR